MPPPVPPTTPAGTALPEADAPELLLLPITMATTTASTRTTATTAPMRTTLGPLFGVALAIFLEASGRIGWVLLIRPNGGRGCMSTRTSNEPHGRRHEPHHGVCRVGTVSERPPSFPRPPKQP